MSKFDHLWVTPHLYRARGSQDTTQIPTPPQFAETPTSLTDVERSFWVQTELYDAPEGGRARWGLKLLDRETLITAWLVRTHSDVENLLPDIGFNTLDAWDLFEGSDELYAWFASRDAAATAYLRHEPMEKLVERVQELIDEEYGVAGDDGIPLAYLAVGILAHENWRLLSHTDLCEFAAFHGFEAPPLGDERAQLLLVRAILTSQLDILIRIKRAMPQLFYGKAEIGGDKGDDGPQAAVSDINEVVPGESTRSCHTPTTTMSEFYPHVTGLDERDDDNETKLTLFGELQIDIKLVDHLLIGGAPYKKYAMRSRFSSDRPIIQQEALHLIERATGAALLRHTLLPRELVGLVRDYAYETSSLWYELQQHMPYDVASIVVTQTLGCSPEDVEDDDDLLSDTSTSRDDHVEQDCDTSDGHVTDEEDETNDNHST